MTGRHTGSYQDNNGIPTPIVKWRKEIAPIGMGCDTCGLVTSPADLALARLHVKTYPDHVVALTQVTVTAVWAETRDGHSWAEAVNG